jgi:hydrogenase maturation protease
MSGRVSPVLIFTYGNPSRGDDALGPLMFDMLEKHQRETNDLDDVELLTDFQLQIEHAVDLHGRKCILFIDAGVSCEEPYELHELHAQRDDSFTTHAMSPSSILSVYEQVNQEEAPPACLLTIRAYEFGLGLSMSRKARSNLDQAFQYIIDRNWLGHCQPGKGNGLIQER